MTTTALTLQSQAELLALDLAENIEAIFSNHPDLRSAMAMRDALVAQAKEIRVTDAESYTAATEQTQGMKIVADDFAEILDPYVSRAFKLHKALTAYRNKLLGPVTEETTRLKREREAFAAEQERMRKVAAEKAMEEARKAEQERLLAEAARNAEEGDPDMAEVIFQEAMNVQAAPVVLPSTTPQLQGTSFRSLWEWELVDWTKLRQEFIQVNEKLIGSTVRGSHKAAETIVGAGAIRVWDRKIVIDK